MEGKSMDSMNDNRYPRDFGGKTPHKSRLGIMCMHDMISVLSQERDQVRDGKDIFYRF